MLRSVRVTLDPHVRAVMDEMDEDDPFAAIRSKAQRIAEQYHQLFGEVPPFNLEALASMRGLRLSNDAPRHSADSEIAPEADGNVVLRLNRDRPRARQRFSIGHEVGHTLFPEYQLKVRCRKATDRTWADAGDLLETLCDVASSEFMFPTPWFQDRATELPLSASAVAELASKYKASREATVRRFVEVLPEPLAAVFLRWKLKPTETRQRKRDGRQGRMFGDAISEPERKLRVDYGVANQSFERSFCDYIPPDKSVPSEGPIYDASVSQVSTDGEMWLDLGSVSGRFSIHALPIYTAEADLGPAGGCSVVAILRPIARRKSRLPSR